MSYATRADLASRYGLAEISDLERGEEGRIEAALADAAAEIDAALGTVYVVPLEAASDAEGAADMPGEAGGAATWPVLISIACDLARAHLYDDRESEAVTNRRRSARARLRRLAEDMGTLVDANGNRARKRETAAAAHAGPARVMTDDNLAGL